MSKANPHVVGVIGLGKNSDFMNGLKQIFDTTDIKLWFRTNENYIQVIPLKCFTPLFPPYQVKLETFTTTKYEINSLSMNFWPTEVFLGLLNKTSSPFSMTKT